MVMQNVSTAKVFVSYTVETFYITIHLNCYVIAQQVPRPLSYAVAMSLYQIIHAFTIHTHTHTHTHTQQQHAHPILLYRDIVVPFICNSMLVLCLMACLYFDIMVCFLYCHNNAVWSVIVFSQHVVVHITANNRSDLWRLSPHD